MERATPCASEKFEWEPLAFDALTTFGRAAVRPTIRPCSRSRPQNPPSRAPDRVSLRTRHTLDGLWASERDEVRLLEGARLLEVCLGILDLVVIGGSLKHLHVGFARFVSQFLELLPLTHALISQVI